MLAVAVEQLPVVIVSREALPSPPSTALCRAIYHARFIDGSEGRRGCSIPVLALIAWSTRTDNGGRQSRSSRLHVDRLQAR